MYDMPLLIPSKYNESVSLFPQILCARLYFMSQLSKTAGTTPFIEP